MEVNIVSMRAGMGLAKSKYKGVHATVWWRWMGLGFFQDGRRTHTGIRGGEGGYYWIAHDERARLPYCGRRTFTICLPCVVQAER